ncbi:MAG TPA: hypothetical protein ENN66_01920 [Proteobacteria bacterium]|nr:hypothetical protein [Pseudomonadota bacterium]
MLAEGVINQDELDAALGEQASESGREEGEVKKKIGRILLERKNTDIKTVARAIRQQQRLHEAPPQLPASAPHQDLSWGEPRSRSTRKNLIIWSTWSASWLLFRR